MKLQLTTIAAALSLTMAMNVSAAGRAPDYDTGFGGSSNAAKPTFDSQEALRFGMDGAPDPGRDSIIRQIDGTGNTAIANQQNADQYSRIRQIDTTNSLADVRQGAGGNTNNNESEVLQKDGNNLTAEVRQVGNGGLNDSYIRQSGQDHNADVLQRDSTSSDSIIYQSGDGGHLATVRQVNNTDQTWSFISQSGDMQHEADVLQDMADLSASYIFQGGSEGHVATVRQVSESQSLSMIRQNTVGGGAASATHVQSGGGDNTAISFQW